MTIEVVNTYKIKPDRNTDVYIGRGSPLGNPWPITATDSRHAVIERYKGWLQQQIQDHNPGVLKALNNIAAMHQDGQLVRLVCFCKPAACHGDHIKDVILKTLAQQG